MQQIIWLAPFVGMAVLATVGSTSRFFWSDRVGLFPKLSPIPGCPQLSLYLARSSLILELAAQTLTIGAGFLPYGVLWIGLVTHLCFSAVWVLADENFICPQTHYFALCYSAILLDAPDALQLYTICQYVWGGIQKLNYAFLEAGAVDFFQPILLSFTGMDGLRWHPTIVRVLNLLAALCETGFGIGLIYDWSRPTCCSLLTLMHLMIVTVSLHSSSSLGPIVPWNLTCILIASWMMEVPFMAPSSSLAYVVLVFFGICPALSFLGLWHSQLSFQMHSSNFPSSFLTVMADRTGYLPPRARTCTMVRPCMEGGYVLLDQLASQYDTKPPTTLHGCSLLAQHIANQLGATIKLRFHTRPSTWDGRTEIVTKLLHPDGSESLKPLMCKSQQQCSTCHTLKVISKYSDI